MTLSHIDQLDTTALHVEVLTPRLLSKAWLEHVLILSLAIIKL